MPHAAAARPFRTTNVGTAALPQQIAHRGRLHSAISGVTDMFEWPRRTSHYLELVNPLWATHKVQARVIDVWDETANARTLTLRPGHNWRPHRAGQHVRIGVAIGGVHHTRTYSISSAPERNDGCI